MENIRQNLITEGKTNEVIFKVRTPITISLLGHKQYPIHDEEGNLYALKEREMSTFFGELGDTILFKMDGQTYGIDAFSYDFTVSENKLTSFLTVGLEFKVHGETEEQAYERLHEMLVDGTVELAGKIYIFDFKTKREYELDVLCYEMSGLYKAEEVTLEAEIEELDTSEETLKELNPKQLIDLFMEVNDLLIQNSSMDTDELEFLLCEESNIIWELARKLGYKR